MKIEANPWHYFALFIYLFNIILPF